MIGISDHVAQVRALFEEAASAYEGDPDARPEEAPGLVLGELEGLGEELRGLTRSDIEQLLAAWAQGGAGRRRARHLYLATVATYEERRAAAAASDADALAAYSRRREAWGRVETVLRALGTAGVRLALALLRA